MLKIEDNQLVILGQAALKQLEPRVLAYLKINHPDFCESNSDRLSTFFASSLQFARLHGLDSEMAVITICDLVVAYGPRFHHTNQWASYILTNREVNAENRVARLREYLPKGPERG
jgi:hypothetical protein